MTISKAGSTSGTAIRRLASPSYSVNRRTASRRWSARSCRWIARLRSGDRTLPVGDRRAVRADRPHQVVDVFDALQVHRQALEAVGDFAEHRLARQRADFLEVGELGYLHAVQPHLPAQAPGPEGGGFPVVLDEADVVGAGVDAQRAQAVDVELLDVARRGLEHHLVLVVVLQAVGVVAVAAVLGAARRLDVGGVPVLGGRWRAGRWRLWKVPAPTSMS